ncbi:hypothetical protein PC129_g19344 [Phytophthora cactorum]|uniref:Uncharacterized protein n=1 Tax=Phytophthora cactorum TaxID=29920 RepID=A0A8T1BEV8_9STRA|nr:hypothetical protein Pcac1_g20878 [Phytophthora cactorum]KAG2817249.1 hypothetical protein PC111_g12785 [Phytophthora cactorum]KAG2826184.1 hypothetical protein PC112_g9398 [Phytophthora cactorum]KAG2862393.1 hypothetical protein PC113_g6363 [Phytophthora cactorum]KAG2900184.1 hypothetical protein PC115_g16309 [Phytophthora cactorum]
MDSGAWKNFARRQTVASNSNKLTDALRESKGKGTVSVQLADGKVITVPRIHMDLAVKFEDFDSSEELTVLETSGALTAPCGTLLPTQEACSTPSSSVKVWATVWGPLLPTWQKLPGAATFEASSTGLDSGGDRGLPAQGCRARSGAAPAATTSVESFNTSTTPKYSLDVTASWRPLRAAQFRTEVGT